MADGETHRGVASNYLCDLERGEEVAVTGPFGATFLMPDDPDANIVMICTGTGSAPFRAFTERRRRTAPSARGRLMLFFGARRPEELPYFGPLAKVPASILDQELVFSRLEGRPKEYVQDRMRARGDDIAALLDSDRTHVYVCGLKGMEEGVFAALADICTAHGLDWQGLSGLMRAQGRYHVETY
jgi:benzoyl-CoA 2,3-dioxygenase component A